MVVVYTNGRREQAKEIADLFSKVGFKVVVKVAGDIDDVAVVGPFGILRGKNEIRVVINQLLASHNVMHLKVHQCPSKRTRS